MSKVGTTTNEAISRGARRVMMMNDFLRTLVTYSLLIITDILFMIWEVYFELKD